MMFALQFVRRGFASCHLYYDSQYAAHSTDSTWRANTILANTARSVYHMLHVSTVLTCTHERGHRGNPFNELADILCTQLSGSADASLRVSECTPALEFTENPVMAQWAFVMMLDKEIRMQYPVETSSDSFFLCSAGCPVAEWGYPWRNWPLAR